MTRTLRNAGRLEVLSCRAVAGVVVFHHALGLAPFVELFVYPGTEHYFAEHDEQAAALLTERVLDFLAAG